MKFKNHQRLERWNWGKSLRKLNNNKKKTRKLEIGKTVNERVSQRIEIGFAETKGSRVIIAKWYRSYSQNWKEIADSDQFLILHPVNKNKDRLTIVESCISPSGTGIYPTRAVPPFGICYPYKPRISQLLRPHFPTLFSFILRNMPCGFTLIFVSPSSAAPQDVMREALCVSFF